MNALRNEKELSENFKDPCSLENFDIHMPLPNKTSETTVTP